MNNRIGRKAAWIISLAGTVLALISLFLLPELIPMHFSNGYADSYGMRIEILIFPALLILITLLSGIKAVKNYLTHSKTYITDEQYDLIIVIVLSLITAAEVFVICSSL